MSFGNAIDDAIETTAKTWMHEVVDPIVDTLHDSAQHGARGGAGARHHGRGADGRLFSETSLLAGVERAAEAAGGLAQLTHAARDAAHLDRDTDGLLNDVSESSFSRFGDADDPAAKLAELKSGLNPARGARDGAFDPRLVWHPPPRGEHDFSHTHDSTSMHSAGVVAGDRDASRAGRARDDERREDEDEDVLTSVDAFDDEDAFRDDDDDAFRADTRTVDRSTAATSGVLLSCERCSHHGTCALGGDCQCAAMFEGKACRITRALARPDPAETKHTATGLDPVLSGFARGQFGGSMTLTRENAPAKLEAHPLASGAAAHNAAIAADERLEVEDDWTQDENDENNARTGARASLRRRSNRRL